MLMDRKLINEVFKLIVKINHSETKEIIPDSMSFPKLMYSHHGVDEETLLKVISILNGSHKIFIFEIQHGRTNSKEYKVEGYIDADIVTIRKLIAAYSQIIVTYYEDKFHKKAMPQTIVKELMGNMSSIVNTETGIAVNRFIMLTEYEKLLQKQYHEYTEEWKEKKLTELLKQQEDLIHGFSDDGVADNTDADQSTEKEEESENQEDNTRDGRVVDTPEYKEYDYKKNNIAVEKLLSIYGIDFFIRIQFRKYEFAVVEKMIKTKIINRRNELKTIKNMLEKVKSNISHDKNLSNHIMEIYHLEKVIDQYLV